MKAVICYYSRHQGNTRRVLEAMTEGQDVELFDVTCRMAFDPDRYDVFGLASGIYAGRFHESVADFARQYLPEGKDVFLVYTSASGLGAPGKALRRVFQEKQARLLGAFHCQGMTTFGPFGLVKGFPKGLPGAAEFARAQTFYQQVVQKR